MIAQALIMITLAGAGSAPLSGRDPDRIGAAVSAAMRDGEPIVTDSDNAMIRAKCGYTAEEARRRNVSFNDGALKCGNGRVVKDAQTEEMSRRISARATAKVKAVMARPDVRAAINGEATARAREAVRRVQVRLRSMDGNRD